LAVNNCTVSNTPRRVASSARTLTSSSSRTTALSLSSSTILRTLISLFSCLVTCSRTASSTRTTTVIRGNLRVLGGPDGQGLDVEPASTEQAGHPDQNGGLVLDEDGERVQ
jgi:hypothetical protein